MYGFNSSIPTPTGLRKIKRNILHKINHISETILNNNLKVKPAYSLYTEVMSLRTINKGDFVGYGANYIAKESMIVSTLPIGYADGMNNKMKYVSINNKKYPIIGDICMDMTLVKVDTSIHIHDKVEIFGSSISIKSISSLLGTNAYHILTSITTRVPRVYSDNKEIKY